MNAVNLIPADARKRRSTVSASPITLALIGVLVAALGAAVLYVSTANKVTAHKAELARVNAAVSSWQAAAARFNDEITTETAREAQLAQVRGLADTRYAWSQLLSQIGDLMPAKAALSNLQATTASSATATTTPAPTATPAPAVASVPIPSIQLSGCAASQPMVAQTMVQLHKIKGVSAVSLASSTDSGAAGGGAASGAGSGGCPFPIQFQVSLSFSTPSATAATAATTATTPAATPATGTTTSTGAAQ